MARLTLTGTVQTVKVERKRPFYDDLAKYDPNGERYDVCLNVSLKLEDGRTCYFNTPCGRMRVGNCPVASIVTYHLEGEVANWIEEQGTNRIATQEKANDNVTVAKVKEGDTLTVSGTLKAEKVSKAGKPYIVLNRIKRIK